MPIPVVRETMWKQKRVWFGLAAGVAVAATAGWFVRPLMDMTAINSVTEPGEIQRVVSTGNRLKNEAEDAGVLGDSAGDTTASTLIGLLDGRGIYSHLANDVGLMLGDLRQDPLLEDEAATVRLASLETEFVPAKEVKKAPTPGGRGMRQQQNQGGITLRAPTTTLPNQKKPVAAAEFPTKVEWEGQEVDLETKRRVNVTATFVTDHESAEEVAIKIADWLRKEYNRSDVPYMIAVAEDDEQIFAETAVPIASASGVAGSRKNSTRRVTSLRASPLRATPLRATPLRAAPLRGTPTRPRTRGAGGGIDPSIMDDPAAMIKKMEEIAPIRAPAPVSQAGDEKQETAYRLTFTLVLDRPAAGEGGDS